MNTNAEDRDINQKLHEAMGLCWHDDIEMVDAHEPPPDGWFECKCGEKSFTYPFDNPTYDSDLIAAFDLVEFMRKEKGASVEIYVYPSGYAARVIVGEKLYGEQSDESVPRAIALAAITALEVK